MQYNKIFLVGMPGSGKSTLGKQLSERLNVPFIDLDDVIEKRAGRSIKEIFADNGESYFRQLEHEMLLEVANDKNEAVVATGGGAPCFFNNMEIIKNNGISVFINTSHDELMKRMLAAEIAKRPKFSGGKDLGELLDRLLKERLPFYEQADICWGGTGSVEELINILGENHHL